jgi:primosomal protein N' (replication factor Y) (superfamily II helicase)
MYIKVKLLNGFREPLWYKTAEENSPQSLMHAIVQVPLKAQIIPAFVIEERTTKPPVSFALRTVHSIEPFPADPHYEAYITQLAAYYMVDSLHFVQRIKQFLQSDSKEVVVRQPPLETNNAQPAAIVFNAQQQTAYHTIHQHVIQPRYAPTVLHGVTGSGKTEIYMQLIIDTCQRSRTSILLLPEVTLAVAFEVRLRKALSTQVPIFSFHSATPIAEKRALWQQLLAGTPILIIGVHLPIMLPIASLGLIIVDEEHETGYQEKKHPTINSKEAALIRAYKANIPIILGSATPSVSTLYNVKTKKWQFLQLTERFAGSFPHITVIPLADKKKRSNFWLSTELCAAIEKRLQNKEQILLFLNRRGHSFFVQCKSCSFIFNCANCSVSLTLHQDNTLRCHYCDHRKQMPSACPGCKAHEQEFIKKGIGTQKLVQIITQQFPRARVARADLDATIKRTTWQKTMDDFQAGAIDILVGTQTITKGYDFPRVTLVGIIWADLNLHFPQFNASETALQQLIQVAGRAGRHSPHSDVIVQTMAQHEIFTYLHEIDYLKFYAHEMEARKDLGYPPYKRLCLIELKHADAVVVEKESQALAYHLQTMRTRAAYDITILGPALPPIHKIQKIHFRHMYLKAACMDDVHALMNKIDKNHYKSLILFTPSVY